MKIFLLALTILLTVVCAAFGQSLPSAEMGDGVLQVVSKLDEALGGHLGGIVATVLGIALMLLSKVVSTEKSTGLVDKVQKVFDFAAKLCSGLGSLLKKIADILAKVVASDGYLGKK